MDDLMENLQKVMNDPESMKQISQLAQMLGASPQEQTPSRDFTPPPAAPQQQEENSSSFDFSKLFASLSQGQESSAQQASAVQDSSPQIDFSKILTISKAFEKVSAPDKNTALVLALKPHLKAETQQKADRLVKIFKLMAVYPLLKDSGILGGDLSGII